MSTSKKSAEKQYFAAVAAKYKGKYGTDKLGFRKCKRCNKVDADCRFRGLVCFDCVKEWHNDYYVRTDYYQVNKAKAAASSKKKKKEKEERTQKKKKAKTQPQIARL